MIHKVKSFTTREKFSEKLTLGNLAVPACHKMSLVNTVVLDFENSLIFDMLVIGRHKFFVSNVPYLLLYHV